MIHSRDFIMRLIEQFFEVVRLLLKSRSERRWDLAERHIDYASRLLTGTDFWALTTMSVGDVLRMLQGAGGFEATRCTLVAELITEAGAVEIERDRTTRARHLFERADELYAASIPRPDEEVEPHHKDALVRVGRRLQELAPTVEGTERLFRLYERFGDFARAEDELFHLVEAGWEPALEEGRAFYDRLERARDDQLVRGGLPRDELADGRRALEERVV